jgi:cytidine deaminase
MHKNPLLAEMKKEQLLISYTAYESATELPALDRELLSRAVDALADAYAPYSRFHVGAAARLRNGVVVAGANTENAAYPMCLCAERSALAAAASAHPDEPVSALAITVRGEVWEVTEPAAPCGACRQVLSEHEDRHGVPMRLILRGTTGPILVFESARSLLPFGFGGHFLE